MTGDFINRSIAVDTLIILYSPYDDSVTHYHILRKDEMEAVISGVAEGQYYVSVFEMVENGELSVRVATRPVPVNVTESGNGKCH